MSKYKIIIIKYGENENYEAEMAIHKEKKSYAFAHTWVPNDKDLELPSLEKAERSLEVFLTEEEYKKVKAEVIKVFE